VAISIWILGTRHSLIAGLNAILMAIQPMEWYPALVTARIAIAVLGFFLIVMVAIGAPIRVEAVTYALIGITLIGCVMLLRRLGREEGPPE
jgi:hypothetical protein